MSRHVLMSDGDVRSCVHCGREPWMASYEADCPGPHPDLVKIERRALLPPVNWHDVAAIAVAVGIISAVWAVTIGSAWGLWSLITG